MRFWQRIGRWLDGIFGGDADRPHDLDPQKIEAAIHLIQNAVDEQQHDVRARRLRVTELAPDRQAELASDLARLLKKPQPK